MNFNNITYILRSSIQVESARKTIANLPLDEEHPLEVVIREHVKQRTLSQNSYYWMRLGEIAEQAWVDGMQFHKKAWHEYCVEKILPEKITTKDGVYVTKRMDLPRGGTTIISTSDLDKRCFADYITAVEAFGSGTLGVQFSANPNQS